MSTKDATARLTAEQEKTTSLRGIEVDTSDPVYQVVANKSVLLSTKPLLYIITSSVQGQKSTQHGEYERRIFGILAIRL